MGGRRGIVFDPGDVSRFCLDIWTTRFQAAIFGRQASRFILFLGSGF